MLKPSAPDYVRKLRETSEQRKNILGPVPGELRRHLSNNLLRLRSAVTMAVKHYKKQDVPEHQAVRSLAADIKNGPCHVFGDHSKCKDYFCTKESKGDRLVELFKSYGIWNEIIAANNFLASFWYVTERYNELC